MKWHFLELQIEDLFKYLQHPDISTSQSTVEWLYASTLYSYLISDKESLEEAILSLESHPEGEFLGAIGRMRLLIRRNEVTAEALTKFDFTDRLSEFEEALQAEYFFVLGLAHEKIHDFEKMGRCFLKAHHLYRQCNLPLKALKALHNQATALSHTEASPSHIQVFRHLHAQAILTRNLEIERMALYNISVHFYKMKAYRYAQNYGSAALEKFDDLTLNRDHYLCLLQVCKIHFHLNEMNEVQDYLELCLQSPYSDIKNAAEDILVKDLKKGAQSSAKPLSWLTQSLYAADLTTAEAQLVEALVEKPLDKYELIQNLFGSQIDPQSSVNRLNNLLSRVRKKTDLKIEIQHGKYHLILPTARKNIS